MPKESKPEAVLPLRNILVFPPPGVDFDIQEVKGNDYKTTSTERAKAGNLFLECTVNVRGRRADTPTNFTGPISQGPPTSRFIYIDMCKLAGPFDSCWQRRTKIPLETITWNMIDSVAEKPERLVRATIPGTGKDGGPYCATVKTIDGRKVANG
jgi:hypothetical protein